MIESEIFNLVKNYALKHGFDGAYATSESLFQNDNMQVEALEIVGDILNVLEQESPCTINAAFNKVPHKCPICEGHGQVAGGFFNAIAGCGWSSTTMTDPCKPCGGTGIIYV